MRPARRARPSVSPPTASHNPIDRMATERFLSRGEIIFRKGQPARHIYKVDYGCVRTFVKRGDGQRLVTGIYFAGDYFAMEMRATHHVTAEAITPGMVRAIAIKALMSRAVVDPAMAKHLLHITNVELQRAQMHSLLLRGSAEGRVGNFLYGMKKLNRQKDVDLPMSRQDIADYLNLTIESVSRALTRLEKSSAITFLSHRRVTVNIRKAMAA
jgi:CRP/FNR family transcriptional regulator, nitrogen fixation regulation protein